MKSVSEIGIKQVILSFFLAGLSVLILQAVNFVKLEAWFYDMRFRVTPSTPASEDIVLVFWGDRPAGANHKSVVANNMGDLSFDTHFELLKKISEFEPLAMVYFNGLDRMVDSPKKEDFIRFAVKEDAYFVPGDLSPEVGGEAEIYSIDQNRVKSLHGVWTADSSTGAEDGVSRRAIITYKGNDYHSLVLSRHWRQSTVENTKGILPWYGSMQVLIDFRPPGSYAKFHVSEVLNGSVRAERFRNKMVLLRKWASHYRDNLKTPLSYDQYDMSTLEVHANSIDTVKQNTGVDLLPEWVASMLTFMACFLVLLVFPMGRPRYWVGVPALTSLFYVVIAWVLFATIRLSIPMAMPLIGMVAVFYLTLPFRFVLSAKKQARIEKEAELQALRSRVVAKSAKADLGFRLAVQVAHDMRNPLSAIDTVTQLAKEGWKPGYEDLLGNASKRLQSIADDLLERYRGGSFDLKNAPMLMDLVPAIEKLVAEWKVNFGERVDFEINKKVDSAPLAVELIQVERAITNLVQNAIDATEKGGKVLIELDKSADCFFVSVKDTGKGIPAELQPKIFDRGFTKGKSHGSGLGLFQARQAFRKLGGDLLLVSSSPEGTHFQGSLPLIDGSKRQKITLCRKVVIVEDSDAAKSSLENLLKSQGLIFRSYSSPVEFRDQVGKDSFYESGPITLVSDLVFDGYDETGFDLFEFISDMSVFDKSTSTLFTSLAASREIQEICANLRATLIGKSELLRVDVEVRN